MDITRDQNARQVFAEKCKGTATPTTLVGTKLIKGSDVAAIRKAIEAQADW